jgi:hypothetical protein
LGSCIRGLLDSLQSTIGGAHEDFDPIVYSAIQSSLHLMFSASSKHGISDRFAFASRHHCLSIHTSLSAYVLSIVDVPMVAVVRFPLVCRRSH